MPPVRGLPNVFVPPILCGLCSEAFTRTKDGYIIYSSIYDTVMQEVVACHPQCVKAAKTILENFPRYDFSHH